MYVRTYVRVTICISCQLHKYACTSLKGKQLLSLLRISFSPVRAEQHRQKSTVKIGGLAWLKS